MSTESNRALAEEARAAAKVAEENGLWEVMDLLERLVSALPDE